MPSCRATLVVAPVVLSRCAGAVVIATDLYERLLTGREWSRQQLEERLLVLFESTFVSHAAGR